MPDTFLDALDEAGGKLADVLSSPAALPSTDDEGAGKDASASGAEGTTPSNNDAKPPGQDVSAQVVTEGPTPSEPSDPEGFDPNKTIEKYSAIAEEERLKALVEKDKELLKRAEQNRKLEEELATLRGGKKEPDPEPETPAKAKVPIDDADFPAAHREFLRGIREAKLEDLKTEEERTIRRSVEILRGEDKALADAETGLQSLLTKESELAKDAAKLQMIIESQEEDLKTEPDDFNLMERVKANRARMEALDRQITKVQNEATRAEVKLRNAKDAFNAKIVALDEYAVGVHKNALYQERATATEAEESNRLNAEWMAGFKKVLETELKADEFTETEQENLLRGYAEKLNDYVSETGDAPKDLFEFIRSQKSVPERERKHRLEVQQSLVRRKASDLPSKPKDNEIAPKTGSAKHQSFNNELSKLGTAFDRALGL